MADPSPRSLILDIATVRNAEARRLLTAVADQLVAQGVPVALNSAERASSSNRDLEVGVIVAGDNTPQRGVVVQRPYLEVAERGAGNFSVFVGTVASGSVVFNGDYETLASSVGKFLVQMFFGRLPDVAQRAWERSSEALLDQLFRLLDERETLMLALVDLYGDLANAAARIDVLEAQRDALLAERTRTTEAWRSPMVVATIALVIATILGPVAASKVGDGNESVASVVEQSQRVQQDCHITIISQGTAELGA